MEVPHSPGPKIFPTFLPISPTMQPFFSKSKIMMVLHPSHLCSKEQDGGRGEEGCGPSLLRHPRIHTHTSPYSSLTITWSYGQKGWERCLVWAALLIWVSSSIIKGILLTDEQEGSMVSNQQSLTQGRLCKLPYFLRLYNIKMNTHVTSGNKKLSLIHI